MLVLSVSNRGELPEWLSPLPSLPAQGSMPIVQCKFQELRNASLEIDRKKKKRFLYTKKVCVAGCCATNSKPLPLIPSSNSSSLSRGKGVKKHHPSAHHRQTVPRPSGQSPWTEMNKKFKKKPQENELMKKMDNFKRTEEELLID